MAYGLSELPKLGSIWSYTLGSIAALMLTFISYSLAQDHLRSNHIVFSHYFLCIAISCIVMIQCIIQVLLALRFAHASQSHRRLLAGLFILGALVIVLVSEPSIINKLSYHMTGEKCLNSTTS